MSPGRASKDEKKKKEIAFAFPVTRAVVKVVFLGTDLVGKFEGNKKKALWVRMVKDLIQPARLILMF